MERLLCRLQRLRPTSRVSSIIIAALAVSSVGSDALACSPPPRRYFDKKIPPPPRIAYRFEFVDVVIGEEGVMVPDEHFPHHIRQIRALRVRVLEAATPEPPKGTEALIHLLGIAANCGPLARSATIRDFPVGSTVMVRTNDLFAATVELIRPGSRPQE